MEKVSSLFPNSSYLMILSEEIKVFDLFLKLWNIQLVVILSINQKYYKIDSDHPKASKSIWPQRQFEVWSCSDLDLVPGAG